MKPARATLCAESLEARQLMATLATDMPMDWQVEIPAEHGTPLAYGASLGLEIHAGHGLTYDNVAAIAAVPQIVELNIGHFLIGEAIFVGLNNAMARMRGMMREAGREVGFSKGDRAP